MRDYRDQRLYQGDLLDKKTPKWLDWVAAIVIGAVLGCMFGYGF